MSGFPSTEGVSIVLDLLIERRELLEEAAVIESRMAIDKQRHLEIKERLAKLARDRVGEMRKMDLTDSGNHGHEHRMGVFLTELVKQAEDKAGAPRWNGKT